MLPDDVVTSASSMVAPTSLSTSLKASEMPIDTDTPAVPPSDAATAAAPAIALMPDESVALTVTRLASMSAIEWPPAAPSLSPSMVALTRVLILFSL